MSRITAMAITAFFCFSGPVTLAQDIRVVDGDTIAIGETRWRLMGYDTPETNFSRCESEYQAGVLATKELEVLIRKAKTVRPVPTTASIATGACWDGSTSTGGMWRTSW